LAFVDNGDVQHDGVLGPARDPAQGLARLLVVAVPEQVTQPFNVDLSTIERGKGRRWCTRQIQGEMAPSPKLLRDDRLATDGIRASGGQHPVQHRHADGSLSPLGREAAGSQTRSDQRLVATHCRFY